MMRGKKFWMMVAAGVSLMAVCAVPAGAKPPVCGGFVEGGGPGPDHKKGLEDTFFKKAKMLLKHGGELNLSDEQVRKIRALKHDVKKDIIMKAAQIEVVGLDVRALLREDVIDVDQANALIEQKYDIKKAKAKLLVKALADLKNILTDEQKKTVPGLYKEKSGWKAGGHGSMRGLMQGPMVGDPGSE
ncbi:MAG TPA: Spy/CpxP family protein refolding chaperone [Candidatus Omnitrophota bacterium]|nr:Spy/CpxP family protein refolding chaperone [Candidatus Omnitrophota bacterium]HQO57668.1 Spy/CpxP family protein refolding chaperone [Candidatus Omnitrophota bacterium]